MHLRPLLIAALLALTLPGCATRPLPPVDYAPASPASATPPPS